MKQKALEIGSIILVIVLIIVGVMLTKEDETPVNQNGDNVIQNDVNNILNSGDEDIAKIEKNIRIAIFDKENQNVFSGDVTTNAIYLIDVIKEVEGLNVVSENGIYGEYITSIMGISQGDNFYWTYYIDDEYANVGVSACEIEEGKTYNFKYVEANY